MKIQNLSLLPIYAEMYDFQYDFMDAMANAIGALVAKHSAATVGNMPMNSIACYGKITFIALSCS